MASSGVSVTPECISKFNELKLGKDLRWIIFKLSDDLKEIVVEETSNVADWEVFREKLLNAKSKNKKGVEGIGARYAVYDVEYELSSGEGSRRKITFIIWSPDDANITVKMVYSSSKDALKRSLNGLAAEIQANDADDIEWDTVLNKVAKR